MKRYTIYRSIREEAMIFGLSISGFAIQMVAVIGGLLMIIFSFSLLLILFVLVCNAGLYVFLLRFRNFPPFFSRTALRMISNKPLGLSSYED